MTTTKSHVRQLAQVFAKNENWASWLLGRLNVAIANDGTFDSARASDALSSALSSLGSPISKDAPDWLAVAEMGPSENSAREWLIAEFGRHDIEVVGRALRHGCRMTLRFLDGREIRVVSYVALKAKANGQYSFSVNYLDDPELDWRIFIAQPIGKAFLRRRTEILQRLRSPKNVETATVTFSPRWEADRLEKRIEELKGAPEPREAGAEVDLSEKE